LNGVSKALEDLAKIIDYIAERNASAAERLQEAIEACASALPLHPFAYRPGRIEGTREAIVHPNYIVVYEIRDFRIEIMNVIHARQQYPRGPVVSHPL
jgi:addiction module RelE/StbE family toxin